MTNGDKNHIKQGNWLFFSRKLMMFKENHNLKLAVSFKILGLTVLKANKKSEIESPGTRKSLKIFDLSCICVTIRQLISVQKYFFMVENWERSQ